MTRSLGGGFVGLLAAVCACALGCETKSPGPAPTAAASASAAPSATTVAATAAPTATAAPEGDTGSYGAFHTVAAGDSITLYPMGDAAVVDTGAFYAVLGEGSLEQDPQLFRASIENSPGNVTVTVAAHYSRFFGSWPDQAWAQGEPGLMKRVNDLFTKTDPTREGESVLDIAPWENKRAIAAIRMVEPDIRFTLAGSSAGGVVPAPGKPTPEQEGCNVRMDPGAALRLAGLPTGHLFAIGTECKTGKAVAERWKAKQVRGEAAVIDGVSGTAVTVAAAGPDEAYALFNDGATGYLATWDGKAWKGEKSTFGAGRELLVSGDGTAWAIGDAGLFKHPKGGAWTKVDVGNAKPTSVWAKDEKTVWVVVDGNKLLRSGPASTGGPIKLTPSSEVRTIVERDKRWPASAVCKRPFVLLSSIGKAGDKAPASYPALTEAVKGNAELTAKEIQYLVEEVGGQQFAGAKLPNVALAEKLAAAFKAKNEKAKPLVFCHEPAVVKGALKVE